MYIALLVIELPNNPVTKSPLNPFINCIIETLKLKITAYINILFKYFITFLESDDNFNINKIIIMNPYRLKKLQISKTKLVLLYRSGIKLRQIESIVIINILLFFTHISFFFTIMNPINIK